VGFEFQCSPGGQFFHIVKCLDSFPINLSSGYLRVRTVCPSHTPKHKTPYAFIDFKFQYCSRVVSFNGFLLLFLNCRCRFNTAAC